MLGKHSRGNSYEALDWSAYALSQGESESTTTVMKEIKNLRFAVVKISNISWDVTSGDVVDTFTIYSLDKIHIHIPIDRSTGKTMGDLFIELPSIVEAIKFVQKYNRRPLKGRTITVTVSDMDELMAAHFTSRPEFGKGGLISQADCTSLESICRNYKVCSHDKTAI